MRLYLFSLLLWSGAIAAQNPVTDAVPPQVKITNHTNKTGPKATFGETVSMQVYTYLGDSLFMSTRRDYGGAREIALPTKEEFEAEPQAPAFLKAIFSMAKGDSVTVLESIPDEQREQLPEGFQTIPAIRYEAVLVDVVSLEELQKREAEAEKMMEAAIARGAVVAAEVQTAIAGYKAGTLGNKLQKTASGLEYLILEQGTGASISMGDEISTHYYGVLTADGTMFDNSFDRGEPAPFPVGQLIPGFNEGMLLLNRGGKAILFIPPALGYGEQGAGDAIPPNAGVVFYIELGL
ncbi:MAG: FKBP-type peptidyl-prolyl cis-trans isomerase [Saprospiraceae bacterium]|nr:FKBP-type peptidyl-prolyl cis-trans isomerase [Saprospiraceae bacterium]MDZ4702869.1 FKBP-type peptidyl-prolyl cis-trans isomerase [Saprospiraceae bacterium]